MLEMLQPISATMNAIKKQKAGHRDSSRRNSAFGANVDQNIPALRVPMAINRITTAMNVDGRPMYMPSDVALGGLIVS